MPADTIDSASTPAWKIHAALAGAQTGFALFPIFGKLALVSIPPFSLAAIRVVTSAIMLEIVRRLSTEERIAPSDRGRILLLALLGVSFNQVLFIFGLSLTTAINTSILISAIPVFTLATAVLLGREQTSPRAIGGIVLAAAGALVLLNAERFEWSSRYFRGDLAILGNGFLYSVYLVLSRPMLARYRPLTFTSAVFRWGAPPIVLASVPALLHFSPASVSPTAWWSLGAVVVFCTVVPYLLNSWALARTRASHVAAYVFLQPVIAGMLAILILGERAEWRTAIAAGLIFSGLAVTLRRPRIPARPVP
ncbi:MAG TPA: DMT family transporter [Thermoanaerobaculia bacterium]|nr:DMT family transporter [Thermoanaerobaculia bacterium]